MNVAVVGVGRIGLPIAATIAARGHQVTACDIDRDRVAMINRAENPVPDEAGLGALLKQVVERGRLTATFDTVKGVMDVDVVLFAVAVDVDADGLADTRGLQSAAMDVSVGMSPGTLCIFDTTLPVGSTRKLLAPYLLSSGLTLGKDVFIAFSPERLLMGRVIEDITKYPKIVGGLDEESGRRAAAFYREALGVEVLEMGSAESAELSKLAEGAYRDLNIALANELAQVADVHGVDVAEVFSAANSQPYSHLHTPGTGVGGHCIPVYPQFLMQGDGPSSLSALGREVNDSMPEYAVQQVQSVTGSLTGKRVLVAGLTFRPNVAVTAHTNAVDLLKALQSVGAVVEGHDPLLTQDQIRSLGFAPASEPLESFDLVIVHAMHRDYDEIQWPRVAPVLLDARNAMDREALEASGIRYVGVGRPPTGA